MQVVTGTGDTRSTDACRPSEKLIRSVKAHEWLREAFLDACAVAFPVVCAGCGACDRSVCRACVKTLERAPGGKTLIDGSFPVFYAFDLDGVARSIMVQFKSKQRVDVASLLARFLSASIRSARGELRSSGAFRRTSPMRGSELVVVRPNGKDSRLCDSRDGPMRVSYVPVPSSRRAYRARGYVPITYLAARARIPVTSALAFLRQTADQRLFGRAERANNMLGAMGIRGSPPRHPAIILDDVVTTGATIREARRVLERAGVPVLAAVTIARTPARSAALVNASSEGYG